MPLPTPNRSSGPIRIYGPRELRDEFHMDKKKEEIEPVLAKIEKIYSQVKQDKGRLDSGYCCCVGLLDPTTNIRVNDIIYGDVAAAAASSSPGKGGDSMAQRSLDGLVTFLTCLFPYLPDAEAVAYLDAADVDPLVAALLIINRRGMRDFGHSSATTVAAVETALRCAAIAAHLPFPHLLVLGWKSLSASLDKFASHLSGPFPDCDASNRVTRLIQIPKADLELVDSWVLATSRLKRLVPIGKELPPVRAAMKRMLLATIHGFYLKAMASLPTNQLTQRYHRSLLLGGYCYGPLHPVENIILNTVWHEQTFPSSKGFETFMISTSCLWQVAAQSMYGLISFLCTRYPLLTPDLALQRLLVAGANLTIADPNFFDTPNDEELDWSNSPGIGSGMDTASMQKSAVHEKAARATVPEAYVAAATAAFHPCPPAQQEFLASPGSVRKLKLVSEKLLQAVRDGNQIPGELFHALCMELSGMSYQQREPEPREIGQSFYLLVSGRVARFWRQHDRVRSNVEAALEEFNKTTVGIF
ncbi:hypothetical protein BAE44_0001386 [Dichanthelium oligosanthes]|uniref:PIR2-like helical domain-containing protein n=1 Tax=Dichanthelium oligosanthes TaxID=888268 RepID=A0A1E5WJI3_9POAL|nr:hypothetical protein BAE44_0001386 [Dichanthelium oligosanthes]